MTLFLCACLLRARSLATLKFGSHLERRGDGWWVVLAHPDSKTGRAIELPLPTALSQPIEHNPTCWRPNLLSRQTVHGAAEVVESAHLWFSESGRAPRPKQCNEIVSRVTRREMGRAVIPRLFRKTAATGLAIREPARIGAARRLLGHATYATTETFYDLARSIDAARRVHGTLGSLRQEAKMMPIERRPARMARASLRERDL